MVAALPEHIPHLAAHMREADREECWAWSRSDPAAALTSSLAASTMAWTGLLDGVPICMFGAAADTLFSHLAAPWLLGTDQIETIPRTFGRMSRVALGRMRTVHPTLANWSDARHARAHAWLAWLGFTLGEAVPMGALGLPFRPFCMEAGDV